jgi:hypothetical protein
MAHLNILYMNQSNCSLEKPKWKMEEWKEKYKSLDRQDLVIFFLFHTIVIGLVKHSVRYNLTLPYKSRDVLRNFQTFVA